MIEQQTQCVGMLPGVSPECDMTPAFPVLSAGLGGLRYASSRNNRPMYTVKPTSETTEIA